MTIVFGIFIILHGLIFLLYTGQSFRLFELQPGMNWPDNSWLFNKIMSIKTLRFLAGITYLISTFIFITGGILFLFQNDLGSDFIFFGSIFSSLIILLFWDGKGDKIADKGGIGLLINFIILFFITYLV